MAKSEYCRRFDELTAEDVPIVGGKNASLAEMIRTLKEKGVRVPAGFATTAEAYWRFIEDNEPQSEIRTQLDKMHREDTTLHEAGHGIRRLVRRGEFPDEIADAIVSAYDELCERYSTDNVDVAVRSSATAEDLPEASFAGQQETFLNVRGYDDLLESCRKCYASLFTDRAIAYREEQGFDHLDVALSVGVQKMVRADKASAGVLFTIDTETGFPDVVVINAAWGLGETVVQGSVTPDEYRVFKPLLEDEELVPIIQKELGDKQKKMTYATGGTATTKTVDTTQNERRSFVLNEDEILRLARWSTRIQKHYGQAMDIEWAKDGETGEPFILQARPETVQSQKESGSLKTYTLQERGERLLSGLAIGEAIAAGDVCVIESAEEIDQFVTGSILVTGMTDPDWVPIMKRAAGIVTDFGGRTSHAAIVSRELGIPAIVGTGEATSTLEDGQSVTIPAEPASRTPRSHADKQQHKIKETIHEMGSQRK